MMYLVKLESGTIGYCKTRFSESENFMSAFYLCDVDIVIYNDTGEIDYTETGKLLEVLR